MKTFLGLMILMIAVVACGKTKHTFTQVVGQQGPQGVAGQNGQDGADGTNAELNESSIVAVLDPCGDSAVAQDELLLVLNNGQIVVSFSDNTSGLNTRLTTLNPGSYQTSDGSNCKFDIVADPTTEKPLQVQISNEHY